MNYLLKLNIKISFIQYQIVAICEKNVPALKSSQGTFKGMRTRLAAARV